MNEKGSQMRITPLEREVLKNTFKGNEELLRVLRKIFLPELDAYAPLGQIIDLWMTVKTDDMTPEEALINLKARNSLIMHLDQCLNTIKILAETTEETEQIVEKSKKNSTK